VLGLLEEKCKGKEIVIDKAPAPKHGEVINITEFLKQRMEGVPAKKKPTLGATKKRKNVS
jgi:non-homologous end joining protein Ku